MAVAGIGTLALLGWVLSVDVLKSVVPGQITMKPNTAVCFLLAGFALAALLAPERSTARRVGRFAALCVAVIGMASLAEYLSGHNFGIDELLFEEPPGAVGTSNPGRMALNTAIIFGLYGLAVSAIDARPRASVTPAQIIAAVMGSLSLLAVFGYVAGVTSFYGIEGITQMAVPTAVGCMCLALGLVLSRPDRGLMSTLTRPTPGAALARRLLPAAVFIPIVLGTLRLEGERAGIFGAAVGTWLYTTLFMITVIVLVLRNARLVDVFDSERREALAEASAARDRAVTASRMKSEFLANMSHEIRTPLNGVLGINDLLLSTDLDEEQREYATTVHESGETLLVLINDILDFSKIEAGKLELEVAEFDLPDAVEGACHLLANRAHAKGLELVSDVRHGLPASVRGDQTRLRQVLTNLLSNAVKFTHQGEVVMTVEAAGRDDSRSLVRFEVSDTGIGIDRSQVGALFDSFTQADTSMTRRYGGTGLGLAISKQLVELMGGEIGVESEPGRGSRFWLTLPFEVVSGERLANVDRLQELRVLVVDDNVTNRLILTRQVGAWGMRADAVDGGHAALEALGRAAGSRDPYDVAILDVLMPDMDGIELARRVASDPVTAGTSIVLLSSSRTRRADAEAKGVVRAFLTKPVRQSQLYNTLVQITCGPGSARPARPAAVRPLPERSGAPILIVDDNPVNQTVAEGMLAHRGYRTATVSNGREALEVLANGRFDAVLMDCQMPEMDGYAATAEIRRREGGGARVPIIAMTAHTMQRDRERCLAAGMDDYLSKPLRPEDLRRVLNRWVDGGGAEAELIPVMDVQAADRLRDELGSLGQDGRYEELLETCLRDARLRLDSIRVALERGESESVADDAHAVKGGASTFGVLRLSELAGRIEEAGRAGDVPRARKLLPALEESLQATELALGDV